MTILSVFQEASTRIGIARPDGGIMSSTEQEHMELAALANEVGAMIARSSEWQALIRLRTFTVAADDADSAVSLPSDFDRFPKGMKIRSDAWAGQPLRRIVDLDEWNLRRLEPVAASPSAWTIIGGQIHLNPQPPATETLSFYYLTRNYALDLGGTAKSAFTADDDSFRLNERTLKLGIIWKYRAAKGLPSDGDLADFEQALAEDIERDKGYREIVIGRRSVPRDVSIAWPGVLGQG